jgi:hypothetical protein
MEIDWNDCRLLIEYYYKLPSKRYIHLKALLRLELKVIYSKFKKRFPKFKLDEELSKYLKSPGQYKSAFNISPLYRESFHGV